jgi:hypothetical protein
MVILCETISHAKEKERLRGEKEKGEGDAGWRIHSYPRRGYTFLASITIACGSLSRSGNKEGAPWKT